MRAMNTLVDIQLTCPVCETPFASRRISLTDSVGQDTDFRPKTVGVDPQPHYVHVCPNCLFAAFEGDYESVQDSVRELVLQGEHDPWELVGEERNTLRLSGSTKYLLATRCYSRDARASDLRLADLYLRASWCARQENDGDREREAQFQSIMLFEKAMADDEVAEDQLTMIRYLVGELYRRVGRHELALALFQQALEAREDDGDDKDGDEEEAGRFSSLIQRQRAAAEAGQSDNMEIESE